LQEGQPSFFQGSIPGFFGGGTDLRCDNPYLTAQALGTLQSIGRCADPTTGTFTLSRFNVDFGGRGEIEHRETYRIVGGVRGDFWDSWHYDVSANYGKFIGSTKSLNNLLLFNQDLTQTAGFLNAIDATRNAAGQIVCRINADADPTNDDPNCVPISVFGSGNSTITPAARRYINTTSFNRQRASELDITANLSGNLSKLFSLPGGPIAFNLGAEYRRERASSVWDPLTAAGATFLNAIAPFEPPTLTSKEGYAEVEVPLLKHIPFAEELSLNGAARYSRYNTAGSVWSYNGGAVYAPIRDIKIRFNYSRSVRAPTQTDLFATPSQNFNFIDDPCDVNFRNTGSANRAANCTAAGIPSDFVNQPARDANLSLLSGGNPNLKPEKSDSYTIGAVIQPRWVPGFAVTVDYYSIKVNKLIATVDAQQIVDNCYDQPSLNNTYCPLVFRDPTTHFFLDPAVLAGPVNYATQKTRGIDLNLSYTHRLGNGDVFNVTGNADLVLERNNYLDVDNPKFVSRQLGLLGDPKWEFVGNFDYKHGPLTLNYKLHFIGHQYIDDYADYYSLNGEPPQEPEYALEKRYPIVWYHDLKLSYDVGKHYQFYVGCDNVTDRLPPFGLLGTEDSPNDGGAAIYDNIGRFLYAGFRITY
jgi:outer membrane receptor protein involved in Fe transport